jgi:hypothetical protein
MSKFKIEIHESDIDALVELLNPIVSATHNTLTDRAGKDIPPVFAAAVLMSALSRVFNERACCQQHIEDSLELVTAIGLDDPNAPNKKPNTNPKVVVDEWLNKIMGGDK